MLFSGVSYLKKIKGVQSAVQFQGVNQYVSPVLVTNPSENWNFNADISKKIKDFKSYFKGKISRLAISPNGKYIALVENR